MTGRPVVHLIDAHFQIFRAYHSLPDLRTSSGQPVGAFRGYAGILIKFLREREPTHLAAAFDHAQTSFRNALFADYKLGRTEAPEDLESQFALCEAITRALGVPVFKEETYEADDVIAALVRQLLDQDVDVVIVSRDKDLCALVSERVSLFDPRSEERTGPAEVEARLGVRPEQVPDYLALAGDAVDRIPGVAGIGAKTAVRLLTSFGRIDAIPRDAGELRGAGLRGAERIARNLVSGERQLALSRELVRLRDDRPDGIKLAALRYRGARRERMQEICQELEAERLLEGVPSWQAGPSG